MASKDRERELARQRYERQLERRAKARARNRQRAAILSSVVAVVAVLVIVFVVIGTSGGTKNSANGAGATPSASAPASGAASASAGASSAPAGQSTNPSPTLAGGAPLKCTAPPAKPSTPQSYKSAPPMTIDPKASYVATIVTNCGTIKADLWASKAPTTVNSFAFLAGKGYFTDAPCHRLTTSGIYVLQCGDPTGTGTGGPGYKFKDENLAGATYGPGVIAMANSGANTNGSQFFINYGDSQLSPNYTPFGKVTQGLDIVKAIAAKGSKAADSTGNTAPDQPVSILSFTVTKAS